MNARAMLIQIPLGFHAAYFVLKVAQCQRGRCIFHGLPPLTTNLFVLTDYSISCLLEWGRLYLCPRECQRTWQGVAQPGVGWETLQAAIAIVYIMAIIYQLFKQF